MASDNLGPTVVVVSWVFAALAMLVVFGRFYVRLRIVRKFTVDDYIVAITLVLALGNSVLLTISSVWGLGQHVDVLAPQPGRVMYTIKWVYLCEFFCILSSGFGRISYAFLLLGLAPPTKLQQRFLWAIIYTQFMVDVGVIIISFVQCRPIYGYWDPRAGADCWPPYVQQYAGYFQGSVCSLVDLILALFPASLFWNLNMELKQKVSLSFMMGLGIFAMVASIVKTINLRAFTDMTDLTYAMAKVAIWWTLEAYLVLLAVSIPTLRPILRNVKSKKRAGTNNSHSNGLFQRLDSCTFVADISSDSETRPTKDSLYVMGPIGANGAQARTLVNEGGIRKDVTVSVTFGESSSRVYNGAQANC
ncbi:hypothetical protein F5Y05DRAFT_385542 [Hypoxylon sp. FL0543]|nr:hypothetical protein F5Y05DRAFT_385542 [Hypoxylon sp. FL0543]